MLSTCLLSKNVMIKIFRTITLPVVLYEGAEENIWAQDGGSDVECRRLHNEEFHNLYTSPNKY
jgi:hypothetical protein